MLKLMYITNNTRIAKIAENSGVDRIFIDLEINGKEARQGHLDTVISKHEISDVKKIKKILTKADLLVRVNPIFEGSEKEINSVIQQGANIVMLPFFKTAQEVRTFISIVNKRATTCLLLETPEAVAILDEILMVEGIDEIHIGLNDLHLGYKMKFMFELLADGTVENICNKIKKRNIKYGFGGIAQIGTGVLPAENIIMEHYRMGSNMVILSRNFCNTKLVTDVKQIETIFTKGIEDIRNFEKSMKYKKQNDYENNADDVKTKINIIVENI